MTVGIEVTVSGMSTVQGGLAEAIKALTPAAQRNNFRKIMQFALKDTQEHTPGSGALRSGWKEESDFRQTDDGFSFTGRIYNTKAAEKLFYTSCITGNKMPKLDKNDHQQTYADIIPFLDRGTRPHEIAPRRYGFLAFSVSNRLDSGVGRFRDRRGRFSKQTTCVITKKPVLHPGTRAYETLSSPRKKLENLARAAVVEVGEQIIKPF